MLVLELFCSAQAVNSGLKQKSFFSVIAPRALHKQRRR